MTLDLTEFQSDLDEMIADLPTNVTVGGETHACIVSDLTSEDNLDLAGIVEGNGFQVFISLVDWTAYPDIGDRVTIAGRNYRIEQISDAPDGISRILTCVGDVQ